MVSTTSPIRGVWDEVYHLSRTNKELLHYRFLLNDCSPGHGLLIWALGGKKPREEFIEVTPVGYSLWGQRYETLKEMIQWFKSVGWRNSSKYRLDFKIAWAAKVKSAEQARGENALEGKIQKRPSGWQPETVHGGLQTPIPSKGTPTTYQAEAAAGTPLGLRTPGGAGSGYKTPDGAVPGTPVGPAQPSFQQPMGSAQGSLAAGTVTPPRLHTAPGTAQGRPYNAPKTPADLRLNVPGASSGQGSGSEWPPWVPPTPLGPLGGPGGVPGTPAGRAAAATSGQAAGPGTPGGFQPYTPRHEPQASFPRPQPHTPGARPPQS